jgi:hypothetical protein
MLLCLLKNHSEAGGIFAALQAFCFVTSVTCSLYQRYMKKVFLVIKLYLRGLMRKEIEVHYDIVICKFNYVCNFCILIR